MKRFPEKFTNNFDNNKHMVSTLAQGTTIKVRNQIAGYITRTLAGMEIEKELPEEEALQEEGAEA
jgi:ribosomal protein S17E